MLSYYTNKEFNEEVQKAWDEFVIDKNIKPQKDPIGYILGGQPGAGKSSLVSDILQNDNNLVSIDADLCKTFHPKYSEIMEKYPNEAHNMLKEFSGKLKDTITIRALKEKYSVIIESTFRDPIVPIKILTLLKENSYKTAILIQTCDKSLSWSSCLEREKLLGRHVNKDFHDNIVNNLSKNIKEVQKSGLADTIQIYARIPLKNNNLIFEQKEIYNSSIKAKVNTATIDKYLGLSKNINNELGYSF